MNKLEYMISNVIEEARRNPDANIRENIKDLYDKYKDRKDIFISFVEDMGKIDKTKISSNKIGINPQSKYKTPNGIYTYPLHKVYKDRGLLGVDIPFAGDKPYVYFITPTGNHIEDISRISQEEVFYYLGKLVDYFIKLLDYADITQEYFKEKFLQKLFRNLTMGHFFWESTKAFAIIYNAHKNASGNAEKLMEELEFVTDVFRNNNVGTWGLYYSPNVWNLLFSKVMGIDSISDTSGMGIIHPDEPEQAVFFGTKAFEVVDFAKNKRNASELYFGTRENLDQKLKELSKNPEESYQYAVQTNRRFPMAEPYIANDEEISREYADYFMSPEEIKQFIRKYNIDKRFKWAEEFLDEGNWSQI